MSSIQSASRRTGLSPTSKIAWRGVTPPTRGSANGRSISRSAPGSHIVSESTTSTTSVSGSLSRRPAAIAARLPTFGIRSTRSLYSAATAAMSASPPSTTTMISVGRLARTLASTRRNSRSGSLYTGTITVVAKFPVGVDQGR